MGHGAGREPVESYAGAKRCGRELIGNAYPEFQAHVAGRVDADAIEVGRAGRWKDVRNRVETGWAVRVGTALPECLPLGIGERRIQIAAGHLECLGDCDGLVGGLDGGGRGGEVRRSRLAAMMIALAPSSFRDVRAIMGKRSNR